jgi:hypothetical protein
MHGLTGGSWKRSLRLPRQLPTLLHVGRTTPASRNLFLISSRRSLRFGSRQLRSWAIGSLVTGEQPGLELPMPELHGDPGQAHQSRLVGPVYEHCWAPR